MQAARSEVTRMSSHLDLDHFLPYRLSVLSNRVSGVIARLYAEKFDLTIPEWRVLAVLGKYGKQTATDVAARTAMDKVRVSRAIARLIEHERVHRHVDPIDRRRLTLDMTEEGRDIYDQIVPLALSAEARLLGGVNSATRKAFDALSTALTDAVAKMEAELGGGPTLGDDGV
ncbi:MarR family winged helix-turn-helix transcriptional regulator [Lacibacterium aquatile]|uniref:MarR family winged helix-turn-helix transcriptional regulator n=1 Tax=Lacibacterium aquatile TaxID=1168082 RepID=A0ABW5DR50_9PROT